MKKIFVVFMVALLMASFVGSAFAENLVEEEVGRPPARFSVLKEFREEIHQINALRMEKNTLQNQVIGEHDNILDLYIAAREAGNKEALQEAREVRKQLKDINIEIKEIVKNVKQKREAFRVEVKAGNKDGARAHLTTIIELKTLINEKIKAKVDLLKQISTILS